MVAWDPRQEEAARAGFVTCADRDDGALHRGDGGGDDVRPREAGQGARGGRSALDEGGHRDAPRHRERRGSPGGERRSPSKAARSRLARSPRAAPEWLHERALLGAVLKGGERTSASSKEGITRAQEVGVKESDLAFARESRRSSFQGDTVGAAGAPPEVGRQGGLKEAVVPAPRRSDALGRARGTCPTHDRSASRPPPSSIQGSSSRRSSWRARRRLDGDATKAMARAKGGEGEAPRAYGGGGAA